MSLRLSLNTHLLLAVLGALALGQTTQAEPITWRHNLDAAKVEASRTGKLVLVHFYTNSCGPCKKLERDVFSQPQIAAAMQQHYIPVKLNADESPALANMFQIRRVPTEVVLTPQGSVVQTLSCPLQPAPYGTQLVNVATHYNKQVVQPPSVQKRVNSAYANLKIGQPPSHQSPGSQPTRAASPVPAPTNVPNVTSNPYFTAAAPVKKSTEETVAATKPPDTLPAPPKATANPTQNRYAMAPIAQPPSAQAPTAQAPIARTRVAQPPAAQAAGAQPPAVASPAIVQAPQAKPPAVKQPETKQQAAEQIASSASPVVTAPSSDEGKVANSTAQQAVTTPAAAAQQPAVVVAPVAKADVWPPVLPEGTPELGFEGYCPVSLQQSQKWVRGNKTYGAIHRGRTYLFAGEGERQKFLASPDAYSPVFSGNDPVKMLDENEQVAGSRKYGFEYRNAFYLFSSNETMERFASQPDKYSAGVRQAMNRMDATAGGTIRR